MKKKIFLLVLIVVGTIILTGLVSTFSWSEVDAATCCKHSGDTCVIGSVVLWDKYYLPQGPCD